MNLVEFKDALQKVSEINFILENGEKVPTHFHITEIGQIDKKFIDCGGTLRNEQKVSIQVWKSVDVWHRLEPQKLLRIIELSENKLGVGNHEIEVEYQAETIGKYGLSFNGIDFVLVNQSTNCLASDQCGIPTKEKIKLSALNLTKSCCTPDGGCC